MKEMLTGFIQIAVLLTAGFMIGVPVGAIFHDYLIDDNDN